MVQQFYSNGKLLLTGEYVVLNGAKALAVPTQLGQWLRVKPSDHSGLHWQSFDSDGNCWFETHVDWADWQTPPSSERSIRNTLLSILQKAQELNPAFLQNQEGLSVSTQLSFPKKWGLGTSSTLINNVAQWAQVDAYRLLFDSFGGSGYDIACAQHDSAIVYRLENEKPVVKPISFEPLCQANMYFVYLNQKQNSKEAISAYYKKQHRLANYADEISSITEAILLDTSFENWLEQLQKHEIILSNVLEMQSVQEAYFADFNGLVKSLGAWGGDFVLALSSSNPTDYFSNKGYHTILPYSQLIK
ncbi:MAG: GHMP kinase [Flavobacterium sp.]|nr:GHMP kinase [Flavobacterium sp.]